jgi:hypothetical protein
MSGTSGGRDVAGGPGDIAGRLKALLPRGWFGPATPVLDALLGGFGALWSSLYGAIGYVRRQGRIATASGVFLDMAARDYLGPAFRRRPGEADAAFSARIRAEVIAPRATRAAVVAATVRATGRAGVVFEPFNPADTGGYGDPPLGYGIGGGYGSLAMPYQFFVTAFRPDTTLAGGTGGYNDGPGGYDTAPLAYGAAAAGTGAVSDDEIYAEIAGVLPVNATAWTRLAN